VKKLAMTGESGEPIAMLSLYSWPAKLIYEIIRTWRKNLRISFSKCQLSRLMVSLILTLVKSDTTKNIPGSGTDRTQCADCICRVPYVM
jgi:hypothetical protein